MKKGRSTAFFILFVLMTGFLGYWGFNGFTLGNYNFLPFTQSINKGLDLQGGISVVEEIQADNVKQEDRNRVIELLKRRVDKLGIAETTVAAEGQKRIRIEIPGESNSKSIIAMLEKTGELKFVGPDNKVILTGKDVKDAKPVLDQFGKPEIKLELTTDGAKKFADATRKFVKQKISIYMDDQVLTAPVVNDVITDGNAVISGNMTQDEAAYQASIIKSGALPVPVKTVTHKTVGATLGKNALPLSMKAAKIGVLLVMLFMILYYRVPGIIADIALALFIILDLGVFSAIGATMTLAGIAGMLLTIGMAVDANVLIFERIKEELKTGKSIRSSVESGFHRALSSILDSNITTIIAGIVLYSVGTGSVKGFALTLMIGIVISIFTALTVTKLLMRFAIDMGMLKKASYFGVKRR
ncbi:protein translocase subunit SecD [Clostridium tepidiprofundi DSM 19306]|uniref:Protein translocase subunit SecD n=1 Tax=Clostridium tepidiprofundi DSM 19306 TaxID=1121338 RepID=A0A151B810_9CLOT|nr:protein translocase subunit SecD [Clostridium tepidiprofundi]KYH36024.1 protein translocase subunit SecD [Clostridium tepidiprofundi DSM 19306]